MTSDVLASLYRRIEHVQTDVKFVLLSSSLARPELRGSLTHSYCSPEDRDKLELAWGLLRRKRSVSFASTATSCSSTRAAPATPTASPVRCYVMHRTSRGRTLFPTAAVIHCRDSLSATADLSQYTTANIADDLEDVRRTLGWPALNLYGTSYGSRLAFVFLRRHPTSVRSVVLKAVAPPTLIAPMNYAIDAERALGLLIHDCAADAGCASAFPNPRADLDAVLSHAASGRLQLVDQPNQSTALPVSREILASLLMSTLQSTGSRAQLPLILRQAALGDTRQLAALVTQGRRALDRELFYGMHLSVVCGEDGRMMDMTAAQRDDGGTFLGSARVRMVIDACANWIVPPATPGAFDAVRADAPILLVSGELDPNTPPRHAEEALRTLPNGRHVVLRGVAHGWSNVAACGAAFVAEFVARASARELDLRCAEQSSAPPFVVR